MNPSEIKNKILAFLKNHKLTVIATVDTENNKPESAVIAFAEKENLELVFGTSNRSRKYKNIQKNPHVSFVIGWDHKIGTVQYEGIVRELKKEESSEYSTAMANKNPDSKKFAQREDQRYFIVRPTWIRIVDMSKKPDETHEVSF